MARVPFCRLKNGLEIRRILNGMWQVSGSHGPINPNKASREMFKYYDAGLTTFDMADIYGPAEDIFGDFLEHLKAERGEESAGKVQALTKWVPQPGPVTRGITKGRVRLAMKRMGVDKLDMLQFHWWDYSDDRYLDALTYLSELQAEGLIGEIALTNFDTQHLMEILKRGISISTNQVQYSIIDRRPEVKMVELCREHGIKLLAYGTLGGGLISDQYLNQKEPVRRSELPTASLAKYKQMIDAWGSWELFQELLSSLSEVAQAHNSTIANVACRYILDKPEVAGIIIGCRFGVPGAEHIEENLKLLDLELTSEEIQKIEQTLSKGNDLFETTGDCGDEYR
ncbi:uncharacterized protein LOC111328194 [Stylophora pistillata]|uniref:Pyridoxal reductase, chloroplastic n=1 Tax=Stylophora pistillata TaxID=50429 RepID=A0A2B4SEH7_STYPI|nr:uncharacterized protein LOC111328194 [Stylophora pistillata]PFX27008.1 Pyridoxal reductase, chloroplastic [Stylophora pistillata]